MWSLSNRLDIVTLLIAMLILYLFVVWIFNYIQRRRKKEKKKEKEKEKEKEKWIFQYFRYIVKCKNVARQGRVE